MHELQFIPVTAVAVDFSTNRSSIFTFSNIESDSELRKEVELNRQEQRAIDLIRQWQKEGEFKNTSGYYLKNNVVYKVYAGNTVVKKITGQEARLVKRFLKTNR